jgi:hypothetical protein
MQWKGMGANSSTNMQAELDKLKDEVCMLTENFVASCSLARAQLWNPHDGDVATVR